MVKKLLIKKLKMKDSEKNLSKKRGTLPKSLGKLPKMKKEKPLRDKLSQ
jgi:hypothetical protein